MCRSGRACPPLKVFRTLSSYGRSVPPRHESARHPILGSVEEVNVGSYAKSFFVGEREFELYAKHDEQGELAGYELICVLTGRKINDGLLLDEPDQADVEALVHERSATVVVDID